VNGSFITDERDPLDVDVAVRTDVWDNPRFAAAFVTAYPTEAALVDVFFNTKHTA
jgi:hypothetical protein